jgi:hypothetical protein
MNTRCSASSEELLPACAAGELAGLLIHHRIVSRHPF